MLCYVIWIFVQRLSQNSIQRRSQRDRQVKRKSSNFKETQMISTVASHSGVQEEYHSKVRHSQPQRLGSVIRRCGTKVQEDHSDQQSAADERSEQISVWT